VGRKSANVYRGGPGNVNCAAGNQPPAPPAPAIPAEGKHKNSVKFHAQADRCVFWAGGDLPDWTYTQTATVNGKNGKGQWTFTYNYSTVGANVGARTAWTSEVTGGGTVTVGFNGYLTSESFLKQTGRNKYSFTLLESGVTRARNVLASLTGPAQASLDLNNVDTNFDTINDGLAVVPATTDFSYFGNGGVFGNSQVFADLHADGRKPANSVKNILNGINDAQDSDNFAGNNNDLAAGNVQIAPFSGSFPGLTQDGNYTITVSGALKDNSSTADFGFSVVSNLISIGGCTQ
jgi:hypothetical protein